MAITAQMRTQVSQLYVALFMRAPDAEGLAYWTGQIDTGGKTVAQVAQSMYDTAPARTYYPTGATNTAIVTSFYTNVLGRTPDAAGLTYWTDQLATKTAGQVISDMVTAVTTWTPGTDATLNAQGATSKALFNNKVVVAEYYAEVMLGGITGASNALTNVTATSDVSSNAAIAALIAGGLVTGGTFTLTNSATADSIIGTAGNDTVNGPTGTVVNGDLIIDQSTVDADVANLVLTAAYTPANIAKIETINLDWDAYGTATYNLAGVTGGKAVNLTSAKVGFLGSATVTNVDGVTLTAGNGMAGTLTASGFKTGTVEGGKATALVIDGTTTNANNASITVNAGTAATSVSVGATNGFKAATVNAGTAATITVKDAGNTTDTTALTVNNATTTITNTGSAGALTLTASDGNSITLNDIGASLTVAGAGNVIITSTGLTAETVTNSKTSGTLTLKTSTAGALDLSKVQATTIELTGAKAGADTVANGANLKYSAAAGAINVTVGGTGTSDAVTAEITAASETSVTLTGVETLTVKASATQVSGADLTIGTLATGGNKAVFTGTNDVTLTSVTGNGKVDATALAGDLIVSGTTASVEVKGGTGKVTVTATGAATDLAVVGQSADDTVTSNTTDTGSVTAILGDGKNTVSATALTTGTLVVTSGSGIDTVTSGAALTTGVINLNLGDGANVVNTADAAGAGTRIIVTGGGDDALTHTGGLDDANDVLNWTGGAGTDTLILATEGADLSPSTKVTLSGVETIRVVADSGGSAISATFAAAALSGQTYTIKADAYVATTAISVKGVATTSTINLSSLTIDQTITAGVSAVTIDASANTTTAQTITGTSVKDTIIGGGKGDTIVAGNGVDSITGGAGNDSIDVTETTANSAVDTIFFNAIATNGQDTITGFKSGTDKLSLFGGVETTLNTAAATAAVVDFYATSLVSGASAYVLGAGVGTKTTATADVLVISTTLSANGNLSLAADGTELLKALSTTTTAATQITAANANDDFYLVAYQNGNAYVYQVTNGADTAVIATEITLIGTLNGITAGSLVAGDFTLT